MFAHGCHSHGRPLCLHMDRPLCLHMDAMVVDTRLMAIGHALLFSANPIAVALVSALSGSLTPSSTSGTVSGVDHARVHRCHCR
jgi:hypothetical protein